MESASSCLVCGLSDHLYRCSRCRRAVYCSKEHQREHWKVHKLSCKKENNTANLEVLCAPHPQLTVEDEVKISSDVEKLEDRKFITEISSSERQDDVKTEKACTTESDKTPQSSLTAVHSHSDCDYITTISSSDTQEQLEDGFKDTFVNSENSALLIENNKEQLEDTVLEMGTVALPSEYSLKQPETRWQSSLESTSSEQSTIPPFLHQSFNMDRSIKEQLQHSSMEWITQICQYVVCDLEKYGICVVDNFVGKERAESINRSVSRMYTSGVFVEGETVSSSLETTKKVRSDKIAWVDGTESNCVDVAYLISTVDTIIMNSIRMKGNGQLGQRTIGGRTKAMIACYPGSGSHYVKHVDNPSRDGRCITSTYYLNKDWDAKADGGVLRIFPQGWANQVVDIEPILDRMVFFWSDRRNPHEVQPSFRTRYAITVWYFDAKEREEARRRYNKECTIKNKLKPPKE